MFRENLDKVFFLEEAGIALMRPRPEPQQNSVVRKTRGNMICVFDIRRKNDKPKKYGSGGSKRRMKTPSSNGTAQSRFCGDYHRDKKTNVTALAKRVSD